MTAPAYEVRGLRKAYRSSTVTVVANDGIDLEVRSGEVFGILGPNGAGKTTLVRQLAGITAPDAGSIRLLGTELTADRRRAAERVAYLGQDDTALADLPVRLAVETTARLRGLPRRAASEAAGAVLDELGLAALASRQLRQLSGGQRRLALVAAALVGDRPVLILDEPTTGLDPHARRAVWAALDRRRSGAGSTVVLVTHNVLEAETVLDRVAILDDGRVIACDTPGRLKAGVGDDVRLELVWRAEPPVGDALVDSLAQQALVDGRRWNVRLPQPDARRALSALMAGRAFTALDDFTLVAPTLEDVYLSLGGRARDLERT